MRLTLANEKLYLFSYFIGLISIGAALLLLPSAWEGDAPLGFFDALFTSTSAVCVTGLVTVDFTNFTRLGQIIVAALIQLGGLGLVSFAAVYIATPRMRMSLIGRNIIRDLSVDEVEHNPRRIIANVVAVTFGIEALGFILLFGRFKAAGSGSPAFEAAFHAISAFCNAGFSTRADSLESFAGDSATCLIVMSLVVLGGVGFTVLQDIGRVAARSRRRLSFHSRIVLTTSMGLVALGTAYFLAFEFNGAYAGLGILDKISAALFQAVTPRTAGFDTIPQSSLSGASIAGTVLLMFIGASPGSMGGGIKTTTFFIALAALTRNTSAEASLAYKYRRIGPAPLIKAFAVIVRAAFIVAVSWIALSAAEAAAIASGRLSMSELFFEAVSAFGTVGLSLGATAAIGVPSKLILVATMFAGRIGLFAMAMPRSEKAVERWAELPDASIMIG